MTRARDLGIALGGEPGPWNAITDVPGVELGHVTLIEGDDVRTGVTAVLPRGRAGAWRPCAAGWYALNGNGEMTGTTLISETGALGSPIVLTNTHAVGAGHRGVIDWTVRTHPDAAGRWLLPVVAETYDGYLNDVNGDHVRREHVVRALDGARGGPVAEGSVGGGTGMTCYDLKGGAGTASRLVRYGADAYRVGAYVQANFGTREELVIAGVPVGRRLPGDVPRVLDELPPGAGSVIAVVATDAPLLPDQCRALARRVPLGLARTGTTGSHFSGDIFLAFSVGNADGWPGDGGYGTLRFVPWESMDPFFTAVVEAVEESVLNALVSNSAMTGRADHSVPALLDVWGFRAGVPRGARQA
ncbi:P1 family peptidase [Phytohabitans rumicis]|uniref:DmpA family aminopeptidase n=1 Tax=Phytohabitans rumicis TaxID=1076125 RepID=UPI0031EE7903